MKLNRQSWISNNTGCRILMALFAIAAKNVPVGYADRPWSYPGIDHGKAVLTSDAQLDCYIHAYGLMHVYKIWKALEHFPLDKVRDGFEIVDWGCGQGIATLTLLAWLRKYCPEVATPSKVTLLDASNAALYRAKCLVKRRLRSRGVDILAVPTDLSITNSSEKNSHPRSPVVVHLLSNIIDVPRISINAVAKAISRSQNKNYVICTGHNATTQYSLYFSQLLNMHGAKLLHRENVTDGAVLEDTRHRFGWDITIMQCGNLANSAS